MKTQRLKKRVVILPQDFQEVVITHEIKFEHDQVTIDIIRKLVYLYSVRLKFIKIQQLGMEYYDSVNKFDLHFFYFEKCNKLLQNEKVIEFLDKNIINFNDVGDIKIFEKDPYQILNSFRRKSMSNKDLKLVIKDDDYSYVPALTEGCDNEYKTNKLTRTEVKKKKNENKMLFKIKTHEEMEHLDLKLCKISENVNKEILFQKSKFEELKKHKLEFQITKSKISNYLIKLKGTPLTPIVTSSSIKKDIDNYSSTPAKMLNFEEDILNRELVYKQQKNNVLQSMMLKDIEDYIDKNMKEMHMALDELKFSFEDEINSVDGKTCDNYIIRKYFSSGRKRTQSRYENRTRLFERTI